jgi:hypothetical protein
MNVEIGAEAALFPEKEYINGIAVGVWESQVFKIVIPYCTYIFIQGMTDF